MVFSKICTNSPGARVNLGIGLDVVDLGVGLDLVDLGMRTFLNSIRLLIG